MWEIVYSNSQLLRRKLDRLPCLIQGPSQLKLSWKRILRIWTTSCPCSFGTSVNAQLYSQEHCSFKILKFYTHRNFMLMKEINQNTEAIKGIAYRKRLWRKMSQYPAFDHQMQFKIRDSNAIRKSAQTRLLLVILVVILEVAIRFGIRNWNHTML